MLLWQSSLDHVVREPLPVLVRVPEPLGSRSKVLRLRTNKTAIVLSDSGPLFERVYVGDGHLGNRIWSTIDRFCSSEMPAE